MSPHRKRVKHFHDPGDCHELTFSCDRRMALLTTDSWRQMLCAAIGTALAAHSFRLVAFVLMPEHVHLLVYPALAQARVDELLFAIKRPFSFRIKTLLVASRNDLIKQLIIQERPGKAAFRFWQEGPGYDRNLFGEAATRQAIDYIHQNPVRRKLVEFARDWKWSSARWYESDRQLVDEDLPPIDGLPPHFFLR
jgi:putative transposase